MSITNNLEDKYDENEKLRLTYRIFQDGLISIPTFREAQSLDPYCQSIQNDIDRYRQFFNVQGILCKRQQTKSGLLELLVLPQSLLPLKSTRYILEYSPIIEVQPICTIH